MPAWVDKLIDIFSTPVDRWVRSVGNALQGLSLAFILMFVLAVFLITGEWGLSSHQRVGLTVGLFILMGLTLLIVVLLALNKENPLFSPYERSLKQGRKFGDESQPVSLDESAETSRSDQVNTVALPDAGDNPSQSGELK